MQELKPAPSFQGWAWITFSTSPRVFESYYPIGQITAPPASRPWAQQAHSFIRLNILYISSKFRPMLSCLWESNIFLTFSGYIPPSLLWVWSGEGVFQNMNSPCLLNQNSGHFFLYVHQSLTLHTLIIKLKFHLPLFPWNCCFLYALIWLILHHPSICSSQNPHSFFFFSPSICICFQSDY